MSTMDKGTLENLPRGTVITVTDPAGHHFALIAEGRAFRDFTLHKGTASYRLGGRRARYGGRELYWSAEDLGGWVTEGLCTIELAPTAGGPQ
ncbi:hypothetical protein [Microbacterium sp. K5D]|uniref:hypothetical protein n=1 Tax=Microbacterium sp. K5D TaxID=2305436 RepID=UPI00109D1C8A|nr:hypothetical protein [Microbacterium sp. K5D]